ncbi:sulfatase [Candidatus Altiarchaeota archaeon]
MIASIIIAYIILLQPLASPPVRDYHCKDCNVILVSLDTLRADHVGCYGYERDTTPFMDEFAEDSILYEQAISSSSWTRPAHASIFTGLDPSEHGILLYPRSGRIENDSVTLAGVLRDNGYSTASFNGGGFMNPSNGFDVGFDVYESYGRNFKNNIKASKEWIRDKRGERFFLFLHGFDIHRPYNLFKYNRFINYSGDYDVLKSCRPWDNFPSDDDELDYLVSQYDAGIYYVDLMMRDFMEFLDEEGLMNNTVVILTSDHGEEFFEHGSCDHVDTLYDELIHVPLMLRIPGYGGARVGGLVPASTSIMPTILDIVNASSPLGFNGSLLRFVNGRPAGAVHVLSETAYRPNPMHKTRQSWKSLRTSSHKLIYVEGVNFTRYELYDLIADPGEQEDISLTDKGSFSRLNDLMREHGFSVPEPEDTDLDDETVSQLRYLGYVL